MNSNHHVVRRTCSVCVDGPIVQALLGFQLGTLRLNTLTVFLIIMYTYFLQRCDQLGEVHRI